MENQNIPTTKDNELTSTHFRPGFSDPAPYPEITVAKKDPYYAKLLFNDYAGSVSEFTAISQYLYHHFDIDKKYSDVKYALESISIVEMHHMDILARVIKLLGENPIYVNSLNKFWNAKYVYYGKNLCDQLFADRQAETNAIKNYENRLLMIKDPYIQNIIKRILLDENKHLEIFNAFIKKYCSA